MISHIEESTGAGKDTHTHRGFRKAFQDACALNPPYKGQMIVDLFARRCPWGTLRNDLDADYLEQGFTTHSMDAIDFLCTMNSNSADIIILDPPFSDRMNEDKYVGRASLYTDPKYMSDLGKQIMRVLRPGGIVVKAGFNSNRPSRGLVLCSAYLSYYGASRNDVIYSVWRMDQTTLF